MNKSVNLPEAISQGADIINKAQGVGLDLSILYESVIDLSADGRFTANWINLAAGILLNDLGLPRYFFAYIKKHSLTQLLQSIASAIRIVNGKVMLMGQVSHVDFDTDRSENGQRVRIATADTRDSMESVLEELFGGHRREYYYCQENEYYTYIIRSETVSDFAADEFKDSPFLFSLAGDHNITPDNTRKRYEAFLKTANASSIPLIQVFNLPETGETRLMFKSDFESPQLPILRKVLSDRGYILGRAYWEPYLADLESTASICSLYIKSELTRKEEDVLVADLRDFLSFSQSPIVELYLRGMLTFRQMLFAGNAIDFTHLFIFKESENLTDKEILQHLLNKNQQEAFAKRIQGSNKATYGVQIISEVVRKNTDLVIDLYSLFGRRFNPAKIEAGVELDLAWEWKLFEKKIHSRFIDYEIGYDIFCFMFKIVSCTLKTNFYCTEKRSFSFRFDNRILDPLVFNQQVFGLFFVNGHYASGTHMRADEISRGGLRLLRINRSNYDHELDGAVLLNYALGPKAQRSKHKDICESGSKGVVVPHPFYAKCGKQAIFDYTEGIMDLILLDSRCVIDYYGRPEMVFFGPDEGTAQYMDSVAFRAKERGYHYWRTLTTGKSFGIPHDTYGLLETGECFGLFDRGKKGVELQIEGDSVVTSLNMQDICNKIGDRVVSSGMTTTSIMSSFRTMIDYYGEKEEELNLMITGGPDGDLGANQIQCYKGKICLIIDGGAVLFDPEGLDSYELQKLAFCRNSSPRLNSLGYPKDKLSNGGFLVPIGSSDIELPDGTLVEDGTLFHRTFLADPNTRKFVEKANIRAFIPCGGVKDTINHANVAGFVYNFSELKFVVEGANVFFDDSARRYIAQETEILQIKDSSANKGGVFSSSIGEVLTAFLLHDDYEKKLLNDKKTLWDLVKDIMSMVSRFASEETTMLLKLHAQDRHIPLFDLSEKSSEHIYAFQAMLIKIQDELAADSALVAEVLSAYTPPVLVATLGMPEIVRTLAREELQAYRNAILTKKLASMAFYKFGSDWENFMETCERDQKAAVKSIYSK